VTLPEVADVVRRGTDVIVQDSKTGEDLTRSVLTQILLEHYPERMELFPVAVLHYLIRADNLALGFFREYLRQSLASLQVWQEAAADPLGASLGWLRAFLPGPPPVPGAAPEAEAMARRLAELERRLAEVEATDQHPLNTDRRHHRPAPDGR
jgi:polyhydroxyalkanoate synthesis repressor PhaR